MAAPGTLYSELLNAEPITISEDDDEENTTTESVVQTRASLVHGAPSSAPLDPSASSVEESKALKPPPKWGKCDWCGYALRPRVSEQGTVFLGCSKFRVRDVQSCSFTRTVPPALESQLPGVVMCRKRVRF